MRSPLHDVLEAIAWSDSYLLGWDFRARRMHLFLELGLLESHPDFRAHERTTEFGDYRLAVLTVHGSAVEAPTPALREPRWNPALSEFHDVVEVDEFEYTDGVVTLTGDGLVVSIEGEAFLETLATTAPDSFSRYVSTSPRGTLE